MPAEACILARCPACEGEGFLDLAERYFACLDCDLRVGSDGYHRLLHLIGVERELALATEAVESSVRTRLELRRIVDLERSYLEGIQAVPS